MKRFVCILLILCLFFSGCSLISSNNNLQTVRSVQYAVEHVDLLISGAEEARQKAEDSDITVILPKDETSVFLAQYYDTKHRTAQESAILSEIFADGVIERVQVREGAVEFSCGGAGIGSNTTYNVLVYIESGALEDIHWYDSRMTYTKERGGFLGRLPGSDNTVFYYKITNNLYYFEAHF